MDLVNALGIAAGTLTTASFVPQVLKAFRSKSTKDISLGMLIILVTGVVLWIGYGFLSKSMPVMLANSSTLVLVTILIVLKLKCK
jgi:MtN3 and saliva related transmembrane protein